MGKLGDEQSQAMSWNTPQEIFETTSIRFAYNNANVCSSINFLQVNLCWDVHIPHNGKKA